MVTKVAPHKAPTARKAPTSGEKKPPSAFAVAFGLRLKDAREAKLPKLTGEKLGQKVGKTKWDVSHWENGVHLPDIEVFAGLCDELRCSADDLLGRERSTVSAAALEEARAYDKLPPEMQKKWRAMRLTLFSTV